MFLREAPEQTVLVHCARAAHPGIVLPLGPLAGIERAEVLFGSAPSLVDGTVELSADRASVQVLAWPNAGASWR